jgi:hypothetical protein
MISQEVARHAGKAPWQNRSDRTRTLANKSKVEFVALRNARDKKLPMPRAAVQRGERLQ